MSYLLGPPVTLSVGFAGTQKGMSDLQKKKVRQILLEIKPSHAHHGDEIGADVDFHEICRELGIYIVGHPGVDRNGNSPKRAHCDCDEVEPEASYPKRNDHIVKESRVLITTPQSSDSEQRSGTWSVIRKGRSKGKITYVVFPTGSVTV